MAGRFLRDSLRNQGLLTIPVYAEAGTKAFICYLLGCGIAFWCISINDFSRLLMIYRLTSHVKNPASRQRQGQSKKTTDSSTCSRTTRIFRPNQR